MEAINFAGQNDRKIAMDIASSEFYKADAKKYDLVLESFLRQRGLRFINIAGMHVLVAARCPFAGYAFFHSSLRWSLGYTCCCLPEPHRRWQVLAVTGVPFAGKGLLAFPFVSEVLFAGKGLIL